MMKLLLKYRNIVFVLAAVVIGFAVYTRFFPAGDEPVLAEESVVPAEEAENQDLITLLLQLRSITLDDDIFTDPSFKSLSDFSQELVSEPIGRPNPFAPLGASVGTAP